MSRYEGPVIDGNRMLVGGQWRAVYVLPTSNVSFKPGHKAHEAHSQITKLLHVLPPGRFTHHVWVRKVTTTEVMEAEEAAAVVAGVPLKDLPGWRGHMEDSAERALSLDGALVRKFSLIEVTLPVVRARPEAEIKGARRRRVRSLLRSADRSAPRSSRGLPSREWRDDAARASRELLAGLRAEVRGVREATEGEIRYWAAFGVSFGGSEAPVSHDFFREETSGLAAVRPLVDAHLNRGRPRPRRSVRVVGPVLEDASFSQPGLSDEQEVHQAFLILRDQPRAWVYPGGSLFERLDRVGIPYRAMLTSEVVPHERAMRRMDAEFRGLEGTAQDEEYDSRPNENFAVAVADLGLLHKRLSDSEGPLLSTTVVLSVGAPTEELLETRVNQLTRGLGGVGGSFMVRPRGGVQVHLWEAMMPGGPQVISGFTRELLPADWAAMGSYHSPEVGCGRGGLIGVVAPPEGGAGICYPWFLDPGYGPRELDGHKGATMALVGEMGGGKTYFMKSCADINLRLGGGIFALDLSPEHEWSRASNAWPRSSVRVVSLSSPSVKLDPFGVFTANPPADPAVALEFRALAERHTLGFLSLILSLSESSDRYKILAKGVRLVLRPSFPYEVSMASLLRVLAAFSGDADEITVPEDEDFECKALGGTQEQEAKWLHFEVRSLKESTAVGGSLFASSSEVPVLDLRSDVIVFNASHLQLDSPEGRALIYLTWAYALVFLAATPRFNLMCLAELSALAADANGRKLIDDLVRLSRRLKGGVIADNQDSERFTQHGLEKFFGSRAAFQMRDELGARAGARFVGMEESEATAEEIMGLRTSLCAYRDPEGRMEIMQIFRQWNPSVHELFRSDPDRRPVPEVLKEMSVA